MCGRFSLRASPEQVAAYYGARVSDETSLATVGPDVAPGRQILTLRWEEGRLLSCSRWGFRGFVPRGGQRELAPINARSETIASSPLFRESFAKNRCVIPADGFYEWSGEKGARIRWIFRSGEVRLLSLAGIWSDRAGEPTSCIVTMEAGPFVSPVHSRQPIVVPEDLLDDWLSSPKAQEVLREVVVRQPPLEATRLSL
jgi:putative SOS response-associated peptidase YedK